MFEKLEDFPDLSPLQESWRDVLRDLEGLSKVSFIDWPEDIYRGSWQVFPLYKFGDKVSVCCMLCPRTAALVESVPGLWMAGFSKLSADTHIRPHCGYSGEVLRFHLGLVGGEECGLRVGEEIRGWSPGSAFVFDDTQEHEAWNRGSEDRVILLLDFRRDPTSTTEIKI